MMLSWRYCRGTFSS